MLRLEVDELVMLIAAVVIFGQFLH